MNLSNAAKTLITDTNAFLEKLNPSSTLPIQSSPLPTSLLEFPKKEKDLYEELISFVEQFYQDHKKLPNQADFEQNFPKSALPSSIEEWQDTLNEISPILENRGIKPYQVSSEYLEPNFVLAVSLITNPYDTRNPVAKLKEAGLTNKQWKNLLLKPKCKEYYEKCLNEIFDEHAQNSAKISLMRLVEQGDLQAIKHFHELKDIYRPQDHSGQMLAILKAVMEILAKYVPGDVLIKVGAELRENPIIETTLKELSPG